MTEQRTNPPSPPTWDPCPRSHIVQQAATRYALVWDGQEVDVYFSLGAAKAAATRRRKGRRR